MTKQEIKAAVDKWRSQKKLTDVQAVVISRVLDIHYPGIIKMNIDKNVHLYYESENIEVEVTEDYLYFDGNSNGAYHSWNLAKYDTFIPKLEKLILDRSRILQVVAVRAVMNQFTGLSYAWDETIWGANISVGSSKITVTISPSSADVEICQPKHKSVLSTRGIAVADTKTIIDTILFYCKAADKNFTAPVAEVSRATATSIFSSGSEQPHQSSSHEVSNGSSSSSADQSIGDCIPVNEVIEILNNLAAAAVGSSSSEFADGWKEALSAAANKISVLRRVATKV